MDALNAVGAGSRAVGTFAVSGRNQLIGTGIAIGVALNLMIPFADIGTWTFKKLGSSAAKVTAETASGAGISVLESGLSFTEQATQSVATFLNRFGGKDGHIANAIKFLKPEAYSDVTEVWGKRIVLAALTGGVVYGLYTKALELQKKKEETAVSANETSAQQADAVKAA